MHRGLAAIALATLLVVGLPALTPISTDGTPAQGTLDASDVFAVPEGSSRSGMEYFHDVFTFNAQAGETVDIDLNSENFDCYLALFGPNSEFIQDNDDFGSTRRSRVALSVPSAGTYYAVVTSFSPGNGGAFTLSVTSLGVGAPIPEDFANPWGNIPMPTPPPPEPIEGTAYQGTLDPTDTVPVQGLDYRADPQYYRDVYPGYLSQGQMISIDLVSDFDGYLYLIGPSGQIIAQDDDFMDTRTSRIEDAVITETGNHQIVVTSYSGNTTGTYTLTIGNPQQAPQATADSQISIGQTVQEALTSDDRAVFVSDHRAGAGYWRDGFSFMVSAPDTQVTITANYDFDGYLFLIGPDGQIISANDDYTSTRDSRIDAVLPAPGAYRIVVSSFSEGNGGSYSLTLQEGAAPPPAYDMPTTPPGFNVPDVTPGFNTPSAPPGYSGPTPPQGFSVPTPPQGFSVPTPPQGYQPPPGFGTPPQ
ncbi:PPC domain-containing protein [Candidatus Sumerlaeota bacterium]|nr:PPC domain-containing protein [Candidatus Sumerlaeota bacterium]